MIIKFDPDEFSITEQEKAMADEIANQEIKDLKEALDIFQQQLKYTVLFKNVDISFVFAEIMNRVKKSFFNEDFSAGVLTEDKAKEFIDNYQITEIIKRMQKK